MKIIIQFLPLKSLIYSRRLFISSGEALKKKIKTDLNEGGKWGKGYHGYFRVKNLESGIFCEDIPSFKTNLTRLNRKSSFDFEIITWSNKRNSLRLMNLQFILANKFSKLDFCERKFEWLHDNLLRLPFFSPSASGCNKSYVLTFFLSNWHWMWSTVWSLGRKFWIRVLIPSNESTFWSFWTRLLSTFTLTSPENKKKRAKIVSFTAFL